MIRTHRTGWILLATTLLLGSLSATPALAAPPRPGDRPISTPAVTPVRIPAATPLRTPVRTPIATPNAAPVSDPLPALTACTQEVFGVAASFVKSGGLTTSLAKQLNVPSSVATAAGSATVNGTGTAVYGVTATKGVAAAVTGSGSGANDSASVSVSAASLCSLQLPATQPWPADAGAAQALLLATFPGLPQDAGYTAKSAAKSYSFYVSATRPIPGSGGQLTTQAVLLTAVKLRNGSLLLSGVSGIGDYAASVPLP